MADEHGNIKSQDTQTDYYPRVEKRVIQIKLVHALLSALIFGIGLIISTTLFINNVTTRLKAVEDSVAVIRTIDIPSLKQVDADAISNNNKLVKLVGVLAGNIQNDYKRKGIPWSNNVPVEFMDLIK